MAPMKSTRESPGDKEQGEVRRRRRRGHADDDKEHAEEHVLPSPELVGQRREECRAHGHAEDAGGKDVAHLDWAKMPGLAQCRHNEAHDENLEPVDHAYEETGGDDADLEPAHRLAYNSFSNIHKNSPLVLLAKVRCTNSARSHFRYGPFRVLPRQLTKRMMDKDRWFLKPVGPAPAHFSSIIPSLYLFFFPFAPIQHQKGAKPLTSLRHVSLSLHPRGSFS